MGREIVYCWKCATRLQGADFDNRTAYRIGDQVSCGGCVDDLICDLPAEQQEAILNPGSAPPAKKVQPPSSGGTGVRKATGPHTTVRTGQTGRVTQVRSGQTGPVPAASAGNTRIRTGQTGNVPVASAGGTRTGVRKVSQPIPKVEPPDDLDEGGEEAVDETAARKKKLILFGSIGGGAVLLIAILLVAVLSKSKPVKPTAATAPPAAGPLKPAVPAVSKSQLAFKAATDVVREKPEDWTSIFTAIKEAESIADPALAEDLRALRTTAEDGLQRSVTTLNNALSDLFSAKNYGEVVAALEGHRAKHATVDGWTTLIDAKIKLVRDGASDQLNVLRKEMEDPERRGDAAAIAKRKAAVDGWGLPDLVAEFDKIAAAPPPSGVPDKAGNPDKSEAEKAKPLSPEMQKFLPGWERAMGIAFSRDYDLAAQEMGVAARDADAEEVRKESAADMDLLRSLAPVFQAMKKAAAEAPRLSFAYEYQHLPGEWKKGTGRIVKSWPTRIEVRPSEAKEGTREAVLLIEIDDLSAGALAEIYKAKKKKLEKKEQRAVAALCLIEGCTAAAKSLTPGMGIPERFAAWAEGARDKSPKPERLYFEARILLHGADVDWRTVNTWGPAIQKSKTLLSDYGSSKIVNSYRAVIQKRVETGKEYVFLPRTLKADGEYNVFKLDPKDPAWITSKDVEFRDALYNFVEAEFYALPNTQYKAWAYVGGCCQQVFGGLLQTTEGTVKDKGQVKGIGPGDTVAGPLPLPTGLKKAHDDHKPKGVKEHPKTPARWEWVQIPLPAKYAGDGGKSIRLLTDQSGFGVKYVIVSSLRTSPPNLQTAQELAKEALAAAGEPGEAPAPEIKGIGQPKDWFVIGPFAENLAAEFGPEKDVDLGQELKGKSGNVKWKAAAAKITGQHASFDWEDGKTFGGKDNMAVYAVIHVKPPKAMDAKVMVGHDDGGRVWMNGMLIHNNDRGGGVKNDEFKAKCRLETGWNRVLVKVRTAQGGFGFSLRITDDKDQPIPGLEWSATGDALAAK